MNKDRLQLMFKIGTPECGAFCAVCGAVLAALLLAIGVWKTLFIAFCAALGLLIGLVEDKRGALRRLLDRGLNGESKIDKYEDLKK